MQVFFKDRLRRKAPVNTVWGPQTSGNSPPPTCRVGNLLSVGWAVSVVPFCTELTTAVPATPSTGAPKTTVVVTVKSVSWVTTVTVPTIIADRGQ